MPTKEDARRYINERVSAHKPPPSPKEIRRQMGWAMIEATQKREFPIPSEILPTTN